MGIMAAQGAVVFGTAYIALRLIRTSHWLAKVLAMVVSCLAWIAFTITGYVLLGGDGGLMDGFGFILMLCFSATIGSIAYLLIWTLAPPVRRALS